MADYTSCETTAPPDETHTPTTQKQEHSEPETLPRDISGWKWAVTSIFLYSLDGTIVAVIQATSLFMKREKLFVNASVAAV
ncbi:hypothetical protein GQ607_014561 [Colletotrichum asianum]|uniref:Uncharacterized protein n=1 Tax=Colletotrichum asianum TaxID=702518 RepID=A0A8H3VZ89_9PEZI|nr:hypothetical protein GQ607_014561 [Colletotrichum asianum]